MESRTPPERHRPSLTGRIVSAGARTSLRATQEVAQRTGLDRELEEAIERAIVNVLESDLTDRLWERLLQSDETQKLIERIAEAPEVRRAIAAQGFGLIDDIGDQMTRATGAVDDRLEQVARTIARRPRRTERSENAGLLSRAAALAIDFGLLNVAFLALSAAVGYLVTIISPGDEDLGTPAIVVGAGAWLTAIAVYSVFFWTVSGQTPGMRFLNLRVRTMDGGRLRPGQAVKRLFGTALSIIPFGLGFLPVLFDSRRRAWSDRIAGTEVVHAPSELLGLLGDLQPRRIA
jgi:uncharacterized RDD family membrane protein YckC